MTAGERPRVAGIEPETLAARRHFDTWDVDHPTALVHLPSGLRVHVCAFSARAGAFTGFPAGKGVRLGPRTLDGSTVNLVVAHEGTELGLRFEQTGPDAARVRWWTERTGEWGLRFWVVVALELPVFAGVRHRAHTRWQPIESEVSALGTCWQPIDSETGAPGVRRPAGGACVLGARPPLLTTFHPDANALRQEYEEHGYWYLESRRAAGPLAALRYNLEEMPEHSLAIGVAADIDAALGQARAALETDAAHDWARVALPFVHEPAHPSGTPTELRPDDNSPASGQPLQSVPASGPGAPHEPPGPHRSVASGRPLDPAPQAPTELPHSPSPPSPSPPSPALPSPSAPSAHGRTPLRSPTPPTLHTGRHEGALDAIRDVIGWNTVYDSVNRRPYTALSRNWSSSKFGGFGVWLDDVLYHALLAGFLDLTLAEENLSAVLAGRTEAGNLPCLLTGRDAWVDRSQPPIGAFVLWLLYQRWGDRRLLESAFEPLLHNHEWWWRERDGNGNGLLEYGTSPVGDGLYRGTALGARNESSMDNSPVHDEATLDPGSHTLDCEDVGLNSLLALDGEMLALAAAELGCDGEARRLEARARALAERIGEELWDPQREVFANRLWSGRFVSSIAPTSFYPLIAGAASAAQARALIAWLEDPQRFGGRFALPSVSRDDPASKDNVYWRGRIWPPLNFLVYQGLRRYGFTAEATTLAGRSYEMFARPWREARHCAENYGAEDGAVTDQPDTDTFYGWGALMPAIAVAEVCDVSPWDGLSITHTGEDVRMGPLRCPSGWARCESCAGVLTLLVGEKPVLRTNTRGRLRHLRLERSSLRVELPPLQPTAGEHAWLELPGVPADAVTAARLDDAPGERVAVTTGAAGTRLILPDRPSRIGLTLIWQS